MHTVYQLIIGSLDSRSSSIGWLFYLVQIRSL